MTAIDSAIRGMGKQSVFPAYGSAPDLRQAPATTRHESGGVLLRNTARSAIAWSSRTWGWLDAVLAGFGFLASHLFSPYFHFGVSTGYSVALGTIVFALAVLFFSCIFGVYDRHNFTAVGRMGAQTIAVNALAMAVVCLGFAWFSYVRVGRFIVVGAFLISGGGTFACRMLARNLARRVPMRVLFVGDRRKFRPLAVHIRRLHSAFYDRPAYLNVSCEDPGDRRQIIREAFIEHKPDEIIVMDNDNAVMEVLHHSAGILQAGCGIYSFAAYYEKLLGEVPITSIDERGVLGSGFSVGSFHCGLAKRPMDIALAAVGLFVGAPLMLLCAMLVKLTSPGPIIYKQVRVGRYGRPFWIYKFRTMRQDAERNGAVWARAGDARVTTLGKFLRKSRFDELPQLWNILIGDMSLVGPRPERPEFVEQLRQHVPHYELRHLVQPGLTGWAQVRFRYGASIDDAQRKLAFDLFYVRHCSLAFDAAIWLRTLAAMAKGAR